MYMTLLIFIFYKLLKNIRYTIDTHAKIYYLVLHETREYQTQCNWCFAVAGYNSKILYATVTNVLQTL